jgi:hypothetical protein
MAKRGEQPSRAERSFPQAPIQPLAPSCDSARLCAKSYFLPLPLKRVVPFSLPSRLSPSAASAAPSLPPAT